MALYTGRALSFGLSKGATFADLADRLGDLSDRQTGLLTAIMLKFARPQQPAFQSPI
jgi:hypothetical protein